MNKKFISKLNSLIAKSGKQQKEIAEALDIKPTRFNNWCKGLSEPDIDNIRKIAEYFGISVGELLGDEVAVDFAFTPEGTKAVMLIEKMTPSQQSAVFQFVKLLSQEPKK